MTYKTPREQGYLAYGQGHTLTYCPYDANSTDGIEWTGGWYQAQHDWQSAYTL